MCVEIEELDRPLLEFRTGWTDGLDVVFPEFDEVAMGRRPSPYLLNFQVELIDEVEFHGAREHDEPLLDPRAEQSGIIGRHASAGLGILYTLPSIISVGPEAAERASERPWRRDGHPIRAGLGRRRDRTAREIPVCTCKNDTDCDVWLGLRRQLNLEGMSSVAFTRSFQIGAIQLGLTCHYSFAIHEDLN